MSVTLQLVCVIFFQYIFFYQVDEDHAKAVIDRFCLESAACFETTGYVTNHEQDAAW